MEKVFKITMKDDQKFVSSDLSACILAGMGISASAVDVTEKHNKLLNTNASPITPFLQEDNVVLCDTVTTAACETITAATPQVEPTVVPPVEPVVAPVEPVEKPIIEEEKQIEEKIDENISAGDAHDGENDSDEELESNI